MVHNIIYDPYNTSFSVWGSRVKLVGKNSYRGLRIVVDLVIDYVYTVVSCREEF